MELDKWIKSGYVKACLTCGWEPSEDTVDEKISCGNCGDDVLKIKVEYCYCTHRNIDHTPERTEPRICYCQKCECAQFQDVNYDIDYSWLNHDYKNIPNKSDFV